MLMSMTSNSSHLDADLFMNGEPVFDPEPTSLLRRWAERAAQRRALRKVSDLPPYLLDDIGLAQATQI
jgi:uncharacterized protein YjiS (DUF1127 family)